MNYTKRSAIGAVIIAGAFMSAADAAYVLDTGTPDNTGFPLALDSNDYAAAEFKLGAGQVITSILGYINSGLSAPGDTFTVALYDNSGSHGLPGHNAVWSSQASYQSDGWNGLSNQSITGLAAGQYWAAFEVGSNDSAPGLDLPLQATGGTVPALAYADNSGSGYQGMTGYNFGVQVTAEPAPVPLPDSLILLISGLMVAGVAAARRVLAAGGAIPAAA